MKVKKSKISVTEKVMRVIHKQQQTAEEITKELKDKFGYNIKLKDIRVNLLYLLRREKIQRKNDGKMYKYHI